MPAQTGSSYSDRLTRLPQFQGRDWNSIPPEEIRAALGQLMAEDQANLQRSQRRWGYADKAAMAAALSLLGYGGAQALAGIGGGAGGAGSASASASGGGAAGGLPPGMLPGGAMASTTFPVDAALEGAAGAAVPTAAQIAGRGNQPPDFATNGIGFDNAPTNGGGGHSGGLLGGMNLRDWLALATGTAGTVGGYLNGRNTQNTMQPNTTTNDPNIQKLLQTMQGRLDKSEPLVDSILSMANGLLPTQYQKGGGGMS